ncbi:MAG: hypothetical protein ACOY82_09155 [Pseudomonadota bacterium]
MTDACPTCRDRDADALYAAVRDDDLDRAIALGLLEFASPASRCANCAPRIERIGAARDARLRALAARERFRAREARLAARAEARARRRAAAQLATQAPERSAALPPAAAAALARAKAKAAAKRSE